MIKAIKQKFCKHSYLIPIRNLDFVEYQFTLYQYKSLWYCPYCKKQLFRNESI